jgi:hypothetical protein
MLDIWWAEAWHQVEKQNQFCKLVFDPNTTRAQIEQMERNAYDKGEVVLSHLARQAVRERFGGWDAARQDESDKMAAKEREDLQQTPRKADPPRQRSRVIEGFHRLGIAVGTVLGVGSGALVFLQGQVVWGIGAGIVLFLLTYGFFRLLGWIVDGFFLSAR